MTTVDLDKLKLPTAEKVALLKMQVEQSKERIAVLEEVLAQEQCLSISRCAGAEPAVVVQFDNRGTSGAWPSSPSRRTSRTTTRTSSPSSTTT